MTLSPWFLCFLSLVSDDSFPYSGTVAHRSFAYSRWGDGKSTATRFFISAAGYALVGIAAPVPVGSAPEVTDCPSGQTSFGHLLIHGLNI
jgi:hypothetical protein